MAHNLNNANSSYDLDGGIVTETVRCYCAGTGTINSTFIAYGEEVDGKIEIAPIYIYRDLNEFQVPDGQDEWMDAHEFFSRMTYVGKMDIQFGLAVA